MHLYLDVGGRQVFHLAGLDLAFLYSLDDGVLQRFGGLGERYLADDECLLVYLLNLGAHLHGTSPLAVVVLADVDASAGGEVGIELEGLVVEISDGCVADLAEVMWQDLCGQSDGDALCALSKQQRELHGQGDGLLVATVVRHFPLRRLGIEDGVEGEFRQSGLDVSGCCG